MSIRMIAIDLDGTLLHDDMTISAYSREVIQKAIQKGYEIVVATGRMWDSARSKVALLRLGNVPVICYTGAWIMWSETGEPILQDGLSADLASRVMLAARERGWEATAFWDNHIYMEKPNGSEAKYQKYRTQKPQYLGGGLLSSADDGDACGLCGSFRGGARPHPRLSGEPFRRGDHRRLSGG